MANAPVVTDGMTPVKYKNNCWIVTTEDDVEWYNYENGRWANVMLSDGLSTTDADQSVAGFPANMPWRCHRQDIG